MSSVKLYIAFGCNFYLNKVYGARFSCMKFFTTLYILYSWKRWWELHCKFGGCVSNQITILFADLNLYNVCRQVRYFGGFQFGGCEGRPPNRQIQFLSKFSGHIVCNSQSHE